MSSALHNASTTVPPYIGTAAPDNEDGGFVLLIVACICCGLWLIYMTFYHSRLLGSIITKLVTIKYLKDGQFFEIGMYVVDRITQ